MASARLTSRTFSVPAPQTRPSVRHGGVSAAADLVVLAKGRVRGLRLRASDGPFAAGAGPLVRGTTLALIMAMTGRAICCDELDGDGVTTLRARAHLS